MKYTRAGKAKMDFSDSFDELFPKGALDGIFTNKELQQDENKDKSSFERKIWTVSELLEELNVIMDMEFGQVWIEGEIGQISVPPSGHKYFSLKDEFCGLKSVCFRAKDKGFVKYIEEGAKVLCYGRLNIYKARGDLQLIVDHIEPWGIGKLRLEFEKLKEKLRKEGLFDDIYKKDIPFWPKRIFLITSPAGAAVRDFIKTITIQAPFIPVYICPSRVQGDEAQYELIEAINLAEEVADQNDVIVITRGGGSLEDLWVFNSEELARRIFSCKVPVVSAVGHEIDFTICDFVSDARAATPTAAAQLVCPSKGELTSFLTSVQTRLKRAFGQLLTSLSKDITLLRTKLKHPRAKIIENRLALDDLERRLFSNIKLFFLEKDSLTHQIKNELYVKSPTFLIRKNFSQLLEYKKILKQNIFLRLNEVSRHISMFKSRLEALNPLLGLKRGFALIYDETGKRIIKSVSELSNGQDVNLILKDGQALTTIKKVKYDKKNM